MSRPLVPRPRSRAAYGQWRQSRLIFSSVVLAGILLGALLAAQEEEPPAGSGYDQEPGQERASEGGEEQATEEPTLATIVDRITFQIPFSAEKGGGTATGSAGNLEYLREDYVVASGGVEFRYRDMKFQGDRIEVDLNTKQITAMGDVILDQGPRRLTGETMTFDLETKTGEFTNAKAFVDPDIFFEGERIAKVGEETYRVTKGILTSCTADSPAWSFRLSRAQIKVEGFARIRNARFRVKRLPLLYAPYILYPAKSKRTSGFLFPNIGFSRQRGEVLGLAYFQTLGESYDTTFFADFYGEDYLGFGNEIRYRPTQSTRGIFEGYAIDDPIADKVRWKVSWIHTSDDLALGFRGVLRYQDFSDFNFFRDFERDFGRTSIRRLLSSGFLAGNWGRHSLTILVEKNTTFLRQGQEITLQQLPEVEYRMRATQLGKLPLYFDLLSSAHYLSVQRADLIDNTYGRIDLLPQLTASLSSLPWLSLSLCAAGRVTWYEDSITEDGSDFSGESLTRTVGSARADIVGPSFSRVFDKKIGKFARFKHIIEPRWRYAVVDEFEDQSLVPLFDQVDRLATNNIFSYAIVNRLLAKPKDEEAHGGAREILSLQIDQAFSLDNDRPFQRSRDRTRQTTRGPMSARLRFNPGTNVSIESRVSYNTLFGRLNSTSLSGGIRPGRQSIGVTWFTRFNAETGDKTGNQARLFTGFELWPGRLKIDSQVNYDFQNKLLQSHRHIIQFFSQCYGLRFEVREFKTADRLDRDFRFALTLKNIGTFLDLSGGTRTGFDAGF